MLWLAGPVSGGGGGTILPACQLAFPCCHGEGRARGGCAVAGCSLLVALALYVLDLFQRCEVGAGRRTGRNHRLTVVPRRAELGV